MRLIFWLLIILAGQVPHLAAAQPQGSASAWDALLREAPSRAAQIPPLERELLQQIAADQLRSYLHGAPASTVVLMSGESLDAFLARKGSIAFELSWFSIDGGGGGLSGHGFALNGTFGQADAGTASGGGFVLVGGFSSPVSQGSQPSPCPASGRIFCDGFESGDTGFWTIAVGEN